MYDIWQEFLKIINEEAGSRVVETWFKAVTWSGWDTESKTIFLKAPNAFVKEWITSNYTKLLKIHLGRLLNEKDVSIIFIDDKVIDIELVPAVSLKENSNALLVNKVAKNATSNKIVPIKTTVYQNYKFDSFVVGPNNSLAYAAAKAVADKPGSLYNPLFIYGNSGLGKTHLIHAIGNFIKEKNSASRILYQSSDRFVHDFINAIRFDKMNLFENKFKDLDVLLIDDIQFISKKEQTQEVFFHIFNKLYEAKKQIVFSSDSLPNDIVGLASRLKSRLSGGLIVDVQSPTLETKVAILKKKAEVQNEILPDEVAYLIASSIDSSVRELEGILIKIFAYSQLMQQPISVELASKLLEASVQSTKTKEVPAIQVIAAKVASHYNYSLVELRSSKRHKSITMARHVAMYFMKKLTKVSLNDIGLFWCRKDHTTVLHAIEKIEDYKKSDAGFLQELDKIENLLNS